MNADADHFLFGRHLIVSCTRRIQKLGPTDVSVRRIFFWSVGTFRRVQDGIPDLTDAKPG